MDQERYPLFVSCPPTVEVFLAEELTELGISSLHIGYRGVFVSEWDWTTIYRINYASRLASRVLLPLIHFRCFDQRSLYRFTSQIDWSLYFHRPFTFAIDANVHHPRLRNSLFAAQVVKDAICDQLRKKTGQRPSIQLQHPDIQLNLFIQQQMATLSFDTSGDPLHKRGYRQEAVEASLRENLAAALLRIARYTKDLIYLDPCCGSGTLLIEAALIATQTPPGYLRQDWGFMRHPQYDTAQWLNVRHQLDAQRIPLLPRHLFGIDQSKKAVDTCKRNLHAAGWSQAIEIRQADFREFQPLVAPNFLLTNPPYGHRLQEEKSLQPLYRALGDFMKKKCAKSARGYILTGNLQLAKEVGLAAKRRYILNNGGLEARLLEYDIY